MSGQATATGNKRGSMPKRINSRDKGCVGEREFAHYLSDAGFPAERGQQHAGGNESPDVRCPALADVHFEVKRTEKGNPYDWLAQCIRDAASGKMHIVAHRRNHQEWIAVLPMDELMRLLILRDLWYGNEARALQSQPKRRRASKAIRSEPDTK